MPSLIHLVQADKNGQKAGTRRKNGNAVYIYRDGGHNRRGGARNTMNEKEKKTGSLSRFFEEKGFYIILFLCVAAIGIAGYVLFIAPATADDTADTPDQTFSDLSDPDPDDGGISVPSLSDPEDSKTDGTIIPSDLDLSDDPESALDSDASETIITQDDAEQTAGNAEEDGQADEAVESANPVPVQDKQEDKDKDNKEESGTPQQQQPTQNSSTENSSTSSAPTFFVKPVAGDIIRDFCVTELIYDRTMGDWRTHNGADFSATTGEAVCAVADGTVREVYRNEFYGTCVVITHGGGLESTYYGLAEQATVAAGDTVKAGDTIGSLGTGSHFESLEPVHLHMEMTLDGKYVNPGEYIA